MLPTTNGNSANMDNSHSLSNNGLEIAVIGLSGRFPGARNIKEFWHNLKYGVESITFYADEELRKLELEEALLSNPQYVKAGAKLEAVDLFDASFFGFNPKEAELLDPQHRLFLECAWEALENAGYDSETYPGAIGVYGGTGMNGYLFNLFTNPQIRSSVSQYQIFLASDKDFLTTRVSYKLNLEGPSVDIQTACSTSLVAVHMACQSLLSGECDMTLAGGVAISQTQGYLYQEGGIYSPDGHCRAFDAQAQGTIGGSGVGIVVLKRLEDALADGDSIQAVIKGSAINNDGSRKVSYTAPRIDTQAKVIQSAQVMAEVDPETITYIEAHGTGTALGDPIEMAALTQVFRASTQKKGFCGVGSVKTNIGHLDAAAGIASLIKTVLALKHQQIPPSLHFEQPNPQIDFEKSPFYVNAKLSDWKVNSVPRRAGVSSFGIGGTNAHVVLEEAPLEGRRQEAGGRSKTFNERPLHLLVLSAKTPTALETATANLVAHLKLHPSLNLADVAYTLQVGRRAFEYRRMLVCQTLEEGINALESLNPERVFSQFQEPSYRPIVFMFPGQGSQYINMGWELYQSEPTFREQIDRCCELLEAHLDLGLRHIVYPNSDFRTGGFGNPPLPTSVRAGFQTRPYRLLEQTAYAQPALFVIGYALAQLWMSWGIRPEAMIGHSIGEYVAACLAGVFSLKDALKLVAIRGRLMQQMSAGEMLSVSLSEAEIQPWLNREISLAANNAPSLCVVSGMTEAIAHLQDCLSEKGIACRRLHTSHAFHSQMMEAVLEPFTETVQQVQLSPPQIPFISNVTGTWITAAEATNPHYWARHLRQTVQLVSGIAELTKEPKRILLEVGPGNTLSTFAKQQPNLNEGQMILSSLRHPKQEQSDDAFLLNTLGKLWLTGVKIDWTQFYANERRYRLPLPTYPFERQRFWIEGSREGRVFKPARTGVRRGGFSNPPVQELEEEKKNNLADWFYVPSWERDLLPEPFHPEKLAQQKSCWLVFVDAWGIGDRLAQQLSLAGQDVITVAIGESFAELEYRAFAIAPKKLDDYNALLEDLRLRELNPDFIVYLWGITDRKLEVGRGMSGRVSKPALTNPPVQESELEAFKECQTQGFYSLLFLTQALEKQKITMPVQMMVVTNNLHEVVGETVNPAKATVLGLCKVIPQEYPHITCRSIDVILPELEEEKEGLSDRLLAEFTTKSTDLVIAYRGSHRWHQTFKPVHLDEAVEEKVRLRKGGTYLIVGDLDKGLGLVFAEYLAQIQAKLILIGNGVLLERIQSLEAFGAEYLIIEADITDEAQMRAACDRAQERFGEIHGVFYSTPMTNLQSAAPLQLLGSAQCEYNFQTKVYGLYVLESVLRGRKLDFYLLQSSLSSIVGGLGLAAYSAANLFIDAFANEQNQNSDRTPWFSVNWDACRLEEEQPVSGFGASLAKFALTPQEVWQATRRILSIGSPSQIAISKGNLKARIDEWIGLKSLPQNPTVAASSEHSRPNLPNHYVAPRNEIEQAIAHIWQDILGIETVGVYDSFFELGGHSLLAIQAISRLRETFQVELAMRSLLFETPTIAGIAAVIAEAQPEQDETQEIAELLEEVKSLSSEEIQQQLAIDN